MEATVLLPILYFMYLEDSEFCMNILLEIDDIVDTVTCVKVELYLKYEKKRKSILVH